MVSKEDKLQSDIVRKFSELYPERRGQLYHPANERNHIIQVFQAKGLGIVAGVADLIYINTYQDVATELKVHGRWHDREHIEKQVWWAKVWEKQGKLWRLCRTVDEAISCYEHNPKGLTISQVEQMLKERKTIRIKF